jgi:hypothetical protein
MEKIKLTNFKETNEYLQNLIEGEGNNKTELETSCLNSYISLTNNNIKTTRY